MWRWLSLTTAVPRSRAGRRSCRSRSMRRASWGSIHGAIGLALTLAVPGGAQVSLTLTGAPAVFPAPAVTDYDNGVVNDPTGIAFTVAITGGASQNRTTIVSVRSSSASLGGSKPLSDLQWRRADLAAWNAMTTADATIESRPVKKNRLNDPWSNTVFFRMLLSWTGDSPGTYSAALVVTLTGTGPRGAGGGRGRTGRARVARGGGGPVCDPGGRACRAAVPVDQHRQRGRFLLGSRHRTGALARGTRPRVCAPSRNPGGGRGDPHGAARRVDWVVARPVRRLERGW